MVLFNPVIEVVALPNADRLQWPLRLAPKPALAIARNDCLRVRLTTINDNTIWSAMTVQRFADDASAGREVTVFAEEELYRVAYAVDGAVEIHPATAHPDISFINVPLAGDRTFSPVEAFKQQRGKVHNPAVDSRMVDVNAALCHRVFQITQAEIVSQIPTYAQQNYPLVEVAALNIDKPLK
jgi:hypothetical protein